MTRKQNNSTLIKKINILILIKIIARLLEQRNSDKLSEEEIRNKGEII